MVTYISNRTAIKPNEEHILVLTGLGLDGKNFTVFGKDVDEKIKELRNLPNFNGIDIIPKEEFDNGKGLNGLLNDVFEVK